MGGYDETDAKLDTYYNINPEPFDELDIVVTIQTAKK